MGERVAPTHVSNNLSTIDSESFINTAYCLWYLDGHLRPYTGVGPVPQASPASRIQEEYMNNVSSLARVNHTRPAREVLEHAQAMPEKSVHREVVLCRLTVGELVSDTLVQLPIVLSTQA